MILKDVRKNKFKTHVGCKEYLNYNLMPTNLHIITIIYMDDHSYRSNNMVEYVSKLQDNIHYHAVYWQYMVGLGLNQKWW